MASTRVTVPTTIAKMPYYTAGTENDFGDLFTLSPANRLAISPLPNRDRGEVAFTVLG
ncbi:MAG: hypothetical protein ACE5H0_08575 [Bacteroidota bacterium]